MNDRKRRTPQHDNNYEVLNHLYRSVRSVFESHITESTPPDWLSPGGGCRFLILVGLNPSDPHHQAVISDYYKIREIIMRD